MVSSPLPQQRDKLRPYLAAGPCHKEPASRHSYQHRSMTHHKQPRASRLQEGLWKQN